MHLSRLDDLQPFTTLDGSTIRELAGPAWTPARNQSLAEASVPPGGRTAAHFHRRTEELYFFTAGRGRLRVGDDERTVAPGDCAVIPPGTVHELVNDGGPISDRRLVELGPSAYALCLDVFGALP